MASQPNLSGSKAAAICSEADELREALRYVRNRLVGRAQVLRESAKGYDKEAQQYARGSFRRLEGECQAKATRLRHEADWCEHLANQPDIWDGIGEVEPIGLELEPVEGPIETPGADHD